MDWALSFGCSERPQRCTRRETLRPVIGRPCIGAVECGAQGPSGVMDSTSKREMTADDVCGFLDLLDAHDIRIWLDGGWAVDASLGS